MAAEVTSLPIPPDSDVEVSVTIHTPLNISRHTARQKANASLALHCGQSFAIDDPELSVGDNVIWRVPVWVTHSGHGRISQIGEIRVDAQSGELLTSPNEIRHLKAAANGVLESVIKKD